MVLVRCHHGVRVVEPTAFVTDPGSRPTVHAVFFLISPEQNAGQHLRFLAQIATRVDEDDFLTRWLAAKDDQEIKEILLQHDRYLSLHLRPGARSAALIGHALRDLSMPEGSLIALIRRDGASIIPRGSTVLQAGDRLTLLGDSGRDPGAPGPVSRGDGTDIGMGKGCSRIPSPPPRKGGWGKPIRSPSLPGRHLDPPYR